MTQELSVAEFGELQDCENKMLGGHLQMCEALVRIHGGKLYREQYDSFEEYVSDRWGLKRAQAYRLMNFAETMQAIETSPIGDITPQNRIAIFQARVLPVAVIKLVLQFENLDFQFLLRRRVTDPSADID